MPNKCTIHWPVGKVPTPQEKELAQKIVGQMGEIDWGEFDRQVAKNIPPSPHGLRTTKSHCCNATVVTVGKGVLRQVCLACGKEHHASIYR